MFGISSTGKDQIKEIVERLFDRMALKLLGGIPSLRNKKNLFFSAERHVGLANLFLEAMNNKQPNALEQDVLKGMLESSHAYIEALKHTTRANIVDQVDGLIKEAKANGEIVNQQQIEEVLQIEFKKARSALKTVAESSGTKVRNVGSVMDISRVAAERNIDDPNVFFSVIRDKSTCQYCIKNHLHEDGTPKVFKLSEIKQGYLSTDDKKSGEVSVCGLHPSCRCTICYLSPGYGFKRGKLEYISQHHDEYTKQKEAA